MPPAPGDRSQSCWDTDGITRLYSDFFLRTSSSHHIRNERRDAAFLQVTAAGVIDVVNENRLRYGETESDHESTSNSKGKCKAQGLL